MKIFGIQIGGNGANGAAVAPQAATCEHNAMLVPHWTNVGDMGERDRVSYYTCNTCHATLTREEGERLRALATR